MDEIQEVTHGLRFTAQTDEVFTEINQPLRIKGDRTVGLAGLDSIVVGVNKTVPRESPGGMTVLFSGRYSQLREAVFTEIVQAGDLLKVGAPDGTIQRYSKWVSGTDSPTLIAAMCWVGAGVDETGEILE